MPKKLQTIYEYLGDYSKEEIDKVLEGLEEKDKNILFLRYGSDLDNPTTSEKFDKKASTYFYSYLIPKIKKALSPSKKTPSLKKQTTIPKEKSKGILKNKVLSQADYFKVLSLLQSPDFSKILSDFSIEEAIVVCLKLGYIDGKHFETKAISEFLGMEEKRIYEIVHKFLAIYKENVLEFIDEIIKDANKEISILIKK